MGTEDRPEPRRRPTIRDVAERAGVSKSLVSLVVHDSPRVSDKSRIAVQEAINELGYRPSAVARSLVTQQSGLVGIVMSNAYDTFYAEVLEGVIGYLAEHADTMTPLILHGNHEEGPEFRAVNRCLDLRVECIFLMGSALPDPAIERIGREVPVATIGRWVVSDQIDVVVNDDHDGGELATKHLLDLGHRRIAHVTGGTGNGSREREIGYRKMMKQAGYEPTVLPGTYLMKAGEEAGRRLLEAPEKMPTAIFAANDLSAIGLMDVLKKAGHQVPDDISIIGYDDIVLAGLDAIDLTTINQPGRQMGETAARLVYERLRKPERTAQKVHIEPALVVRSTTAAISRN